MMDSALGNRSRRHDVAVPAPRPGLIQRTDYYYHVGVRPTETFTALRTTQASADQATVVVCPGADVREGRLGSGAWVVESVLVPLDAARDGREAEALVRRLVDRIES